MYNGYRIVSVTPAGRRRNLEILVPHLLAQRHVIDEHQFWVNTVVPEDIAYLEAVQAAYPDFFHLRYLPDPRPELSGQARSTLICQFFPACTDDNTVYVRFDDDICWIAPNAVEELVEFRIAHPEYFLVFPAIVNNAICTYLEQRMGALPSVVEACEYACQGNAWSNPEIGAQAHVDFLNAAEAGDVSVFQFGAWECRDFERVSINCIAWLGSAFAEFGGFVGPDEELWLTETKPRASGRPNCLWGKSLVSHFAFFTQRTHLEAETDLLARYRALAPALPLVDVPAETRLSADDPRLRHAERALAGGHDTYAALLLADLARAYPTSVDVLNNLGLVFWNQGDLRAAIDTFRQALAVAPGHRASILNCAEALQACGEGREADALCRGYLQTHPDDLQAQKALQNGTRQAA